MSRIIIYCMLYGDCGLSGVRGLRDGGRTLSYKMSQKRTVAPSKRMQSCILLGMLSNRPCSTSNVIELLISFREASSWAAVVHTSILDRL